MHLASAVSSRGRGHTLSILSGGDHEAVQLGRGPLQWERQ